MPHAGPVAAAGFGIATADARPDGGWIDPARTPSDASVAPCGSIGALRLCPCGPIGRAFGEVTAGAPLPDAVLIAGVDGARGRAFAPGSVGCSACM